MLWTKGLQRVGRDLLEVVLPGICNACREAADEGEWSPLLCRECAAAFPYLEAPVPLPSGLAAGLAFARFEGPARALLMALKYGGLLRAGRVIGERMAACCAAQPCLRGADLLVPVPLHWRRRWARGHNQAAVLAKAIRRAGCAPPVVEALRRRRATRAQVGLDRRQRRANVDGAFVTRDRHGSVLDNSVVVLVDDVVTTGATAAAAARALRAAGAREVWLYTAAAANPPSVGRMAGPC